MSEKSVQRLLVFMPPRRSLGRAQLGTGTVVRYISVDGARTVEATAPIALLPKAAAVDIAFDCSDVFVAAIAAPKLSEAKLRLALPNLLEDRLLSGLEDSHCAFELPRTGNPATTIADAPKLPVAAIDRGWLTRALDVFEEAGLRPRAAFSEIYTVPAPVAGRISVRVEQERGVARTGRHDGFAFALGDDPPPALQLALRQLGASTISAYGVEAVSLTRFDAALGAQVEDSGRPVDLAASEDAVNLLQGPFAVGGRLALGPVVTRLLKSGALRAPLAWLTTAALVAIGGLNAYWFKLDSEARGLRSSMVAAYRSAFPESTAPPVDPVLQTRRQMNLLRARSGVASADDFSVLDAQLAQLLASVPVGALGGLDYRDGVLKVMLKPGIADNPALQNNLRAQAVQRGLNLRFDSDGTARIAPISP